MKDILDQRLTEPTTTEEKNIALLIKVAFLAWMPLLKQGQQCRRRTRHSSSNSLLLPVPCLSMHLRHNNEGMHKMHMYFPCCFSDAHVHQLKPEQALQSYMFFIFVFGNVRMLLVYTEQSVEVFSSFSPFSLLEFEFNKLTHYL